MAAYLAFDLCLARFCEKEGCQEEQKKGLDFASMKRILSTQNVMVAKSWLNENEDKLRRMKKDIFPEVV